MIENMESMRSDVDRFCPLPISGLTVFLRSRATADIPSRVLIRSRQRLAASPRSSRKSSAQALFHVCFFHDLGVRKSAEALPANDVVYLRVSLGEWTAPLCRARGLLLSAWERCCP